MEKICSIKGLIHYYLFGIVECYLIQITTKCDAQKSTENWSSVQHTKAYL